MHLSGSAPSCKSNISDHHSYMEWFIGLLVLSGVEALVDGLMGLDYMLTHTHFYNLASDVWHLEEGLLVDWLIGLLQH